MSRSKSARDDQNLFHAHHYLPDEVIDAILTRLPIKDAVRTSILSRKWRFQWHKMSKLVFDKGSCPVNDNRQHHSSEQQLVRIIDSVLSLHFGVIQRFEMMIDIPGFPDVDRWILILWRNQVQEIILKFEGGEPYRVPSHLFRCSQLSRLDLCHCELRPSLSFTELPNVKTLYLEKILDRGGRVEALISSCPSLRFLILEEVEGPDHLKINAPDLEYLYLVNVYFYIDMRYAPAVSTLSFQLDNPRYDQDLNQDKRINVVKILDCLSELEKLEARTFSLQWFSCGGGGVLERLPVTYDYLEELAISLDFTVKEEFMASLCLLRSSPNLEVLEVIVCNEPAEGRTISDLSGHRNLNITFSRLRIVRVAKMVGTEEELLLVKYILANAPALRVIEMSVDPQKVLDVSIYIEIMRYPRASTVAEIVYKDKLLISDEN